MNIIKTNSNRYTDSVFYLKINRETDDAIVCFFNWVRICEELGADYYVVCDNNNLKNKLIGVSGAGDCVSSKNSRFISSYRDELIVLCNHLVDDYWRNAAYAALTPFIHAKRNGFKRIWNIDGDDTMLLADTRTSGELLLKVEEYSEKQQIDCLSLDMHYSHVSFNAHLRHWSLGIVCANMNTDYIDILETGKNLAKKMHYSPHIWNIDSFFSFLHDSRLLQCETFDFNNLWFSHSKQKGYHYRNRYQRHLCQLPWYSHQCGFKHSYEWFPTADDVVSFDIGLTETTSSLRFEDKIAFESLLFRADKILNANDNNLSFDQKKECALEIVNKILFGYFEYQRKSVESLILTEQISNNDSFIFFGCSCNEANDNYTSFVYTILLCATDTPILFCDNDKLKQGETYMGRKIISPEDLKKT